MSRLLIREGGQEAARECTEDRSDGEPVLELLLRDRGGRYVKELDGDGVAACVLNDESDRDGAEWLRDDADRQEFAWEQTSVRSVLTLYGPLRVKKD